MIQAWIFLILAIALEVAGTTAMKFSDGFSKLLPSVLIFVCYALSFVALTFALKKFEMGIAYAIWAGLGTVLITVIGIMYFEESSNLLKFFSILLIMIGVIGLHLSGNNT